MKRGKIVGHHREFYRTSFHRAGNYQYRTQMISAQDSNQKIELVTAKLGHVFGFKRDTIDFKDHSFFESKYENGNFLSQIIRSASSNSKKQISNDSVNKILNNKEIADKKIQLSNNLLVKKHKMILFK